MSEEALLGAILLKPSIYPHLIVDEKHFEKPNAKMAMKAIKLCASKGIEPNIVDVTQQVDGGNDFPYFVSRLTSNVPSAANWRHYQSDVISAYRRRMLRKMGEDMQRDAKNPSLSVDEILTGVERTLTDILSEGPHDEIHSMSDVMLKSIQVVEDRFNQVGDGPGIPTGFPKLDSYILGFEKQKLYIIGGRPSTGKTALALTFARNIGNKKTGNPGFISLESSEEEIGIRALAQESKTDSTRLLSGLITGSEIRTIVDSAGVIADSKWAIYDKANATIDQVKSAARRMVLMHGCDILFVDYLQLITGKAKGESRFDHITNVSMELKQLARDLDIPVVATAQLNRDTENKRPTMSNLRDAGQIEQDSDCIMLLHRPNREEEMKNGTSVWGITLIIEKKRDGRTGDIQMSFNAPYVLFTEQAREV